MNRAWLSLAALCALSTGAFAEGAPRLVPLAPAVQWAKAEFSVEDLPPYPSVDNPLDPDQIAVDADITAPSGRVQSVPAFWYQDFARDPARQGDAVLPRGKAGWRIRYTPDEPGEYAFRVHWSVRGRLMPPLALARVSVAAAPRPPGTGWVRVGPDHSSFETSDGQPLRLVGENICWPEGGGTGDYERWFGRLSQAGGNFARLWMCPWWADFEQTPGTLTHYPQEEAWRLDRVFDTADQDRIYLLLCLDFHGMYQTESKSWGGKNNFWTRNPYSAEQAGPCASADEFFTSEAARHVYQKRLRYIVARYGYSRRLLAWQFFNEIDNVFGHGLKEPDVIAWHRAMGAWLKAHDPFGHLVTSSLTGGSDRPEFWAMPEMDFTDYHSYQDPAPGRRIAALSRDFVKRYGRPVLIDEFGMSAASWSLATDPYLRGFRQALWSGALGGSVGTSMSWWWQDIDRDGVYPLYASLSRILGAAGWRSGAWAPASIDGPGETPRELGPDSPSAPVFDADVALNAGRRLPLSGVAAVGSPLAAERASEQLSRFVYGAANPELPHSLRLRAVAADRARLLVRVNYAAAAATLHVRLGGSEVLSRQLPQSAPRGSSDANPLYEVEVALPAGPQSIEIANDGADLVALDSVRLERVRSVGFKGGWDFAPQAVGLRSAGRAVVYVTSPWVVYPAGALRLHAPKVRGASVVIRDWPDGPFDACWYSTTDGRRLGVTIGLAAGGSASVAVPVFDDDVVGVVTRRASR